MVEDLTIADWEKISVVAVLGLSVAGFVRGWVVSGREHRRVIAERDKQTEVASKTLDAMALFMRGERRRG